MTSASISGARTGMRPAFIKGLPSVVTQSPTLWPYPASV
jgi:hypothetical protein